MIIERESYVVDISLSLSFCVPPTLREENSIYSYIIIDNNYNTKSPLLSLSTLIHASALTPLAAIVWKERRSRHKKEIRFVLETIASDGVNV